jgi:RHS repeat-associated protein
VQTLLLRILTRLSLPVLAAAIVTGVFAPAALAAAGHTVGHFDVSSFGDAQYSIPLWTPPGTHGLTPRLSLDYSSNNGNGWMGEGFTLSIVSAITRCNWTVAQDGSGITFPAPFSPNDRLCIDGSRLRLTAGSSYGAANSTYQTESESLRQVTVEGTNSYGPTWLEVRDGNGLTYEYGNTADSQILLINGAGALSQVPLQWALNRIRDANGNYIDFVYSEDATRGGYYLAEIHWGGNLNAGTSPAYKAVFANESADRPDVIFQNFSPPMGSLASSQFNYYKRLSQITITHIPTGAVVRQYQLSYAPPLPGGHSLVQSFTECGLGGSDCLVPTLFSWITATAPVTTTTTGQSAPAGVTPFVMDINGDGIDDLVWSSTATSGTGTWLYMLGTSSGTFGAVQNTGIANNGFASAQPADIDGDGRADLMVPYSGGTWWVLHANGQGFDSPANTNVAFGSPTAFADINGDGRDDMVYIDTGQLAVRLNTGSAFGAETLPVLNYPWPVVNVYPISGKGRSTSKRRQDFDGDGLEDLVIQLDHIDAVGNHTAYTHTVMGAGTTLRDGVDYGPVFYYGSGDFLGDGRKEIVWGSGGNLYTALSPGAPVFSGSDFTGVAMVDWDGDGKEDLLVSQGGAWAVYPATGTGFGTSSFIGVDNSAGGAYPGDFHGGGLQDLLVMNNNTMELAEHSATTPWVSTEALQTVTDGFGASATFAYALLSDPTVHTPVAGPGYPLASPSSPQGVVKSVTATDGSGTGSMYTLTVTYKGAQEDVSGRGFLGFLQRTINDSRNGQFEDVSYDQTFPLTGSVTADTLYQSNHLTPIRSTTKDVRTLQLDSTPGNQRALVYAYSQTAKQYELGGSKNGSLIATSTSTYGTPDQFNNFSSILTTVQDNDATSPASPHVGQSWSSTTATTFSVDQSNWCLHLPSQVQVTNQAFDGSTITRTVGYTPDTSTCRQTARTTEPVPSQYSALYQLTESYAFDTFGNTKSVAMSGVGVAQCTSGSPCTTQVDWGATGQFPMTVTNALNQQTQKNYDFRLGVQTSEIDANNITTSWQYDNFARQSQETRPDGTYTGWQYSDCATSGCLVGAHGLVVAQTLYTTNGTVVSDGTLWMGPSDQPILSKQRLLSGAYTRSEIDYDALGRVRQQSIPCGWVAVSTPCPYATTVTYDLANRPVTVSRPQNQTVTTAQSNGFQYLGLTTVTTDPQQMHTTSVVNVIGKLAQSEDQNGYLQNFAYDAFGSLTTVSDSASHTLQTSTYDYGVAAFQRSVNDSDLGTRSYNYDALGELLSWSDGKGQNFSSTYDALSRPQQRIEPDLTTTWVWGNTASAFNIGKLASVTANGYAEARSYDGAGRMTNRSISISGDTTYSYDYTYDPTTGLLSTLSYPVSTSSYRLKLQYGYQNGMLQQIADANATATVFWTANATNARGQLTQETLGNGVVMTRAFDAVTGWVDSLQAGVGGGGALQNQSYLFDQVGNVTQRQDNNKGFTESFYYDNLYRLSYSTLANNGAAATNLQMGYDTVGMGNIASRSDVGNGSTWVYDSTHPHQVLTAGPNSYAYDPNGNVTSRNGGAITWTSYNYPSVINSGSESETFAYDQDRQRYYQAYTSAAGSEKTYYVGGLLEKTTLACGVTAWRHYVYAGGKAVAIVIRKGTGFNAVRYVLQDHQGGTAAFLDESGQVLVQESFQPFGAGRSPADWSSATSSNDAAVIANISRRGFTFHTMLGQPGTAGAMDLIHMNGRVEDAVTGRFLSPDPNVQSLGDTQAFNRYSYVGNNPLSYVDPTGFATQPNPGPCGNVGQDPCGGGGASGDGCEGGACVPPIFQLTPEQVAQALQIPLEQVLISGKQLLDPNWFTYVALSNPDLPGAMEGAMAEVTITAKKATNSCPGAGADPLDFRQSAPNDPTKGYTPTHDLPAGSSVVTAPNGRHFFAPPNADFVAVYQYGKSLAAASTGFEFGFLWAHGYGATFDFQRGNNLFNGNFTYAANYAIGIDFAAAGQSAAYAKFLASVIKNTTSGGRGSNTAPEAIQQGYAAAKSGACGQ